MGAPTLTTVPTASGQDSPAAAVAELLRRATAATDAGRPYTADLDSQLDDVAPLIDRDPAEAAGTLARILHGRLPAVRARLAAADGPVSPRWAGELDRVAAASLATKLILDGR